MAGDFISESWAISAGISNQAADRRGGQAQSRSRAPRICRAARCDRPGSGESHLKTLRLFAFGSTEREQAERLLVNVENLQTILEDFCHRLRERVNSRGI